ncbi:MAG: hypothetical protein ACLRPQ_02680 [Streptococcus sp.]
MVSMQSGSSSVLNTLQTKYRHDNDENIDELIEVNEDNKVNFIDRTIEDNAEKFSQALLKKTAQIFESLIIRQH